MFKSNWTETLFGLDSVKVVSVFCVCVFAPARCSSCLLKIRAKPMSHAENIVSFAQKPAVLDCVLMSPAFWVWFLSFLSWPSDSQQHFMCVYARDDNFCSFFIIQQIVWSRVMCNATCAAQKVRIKAFAEWMHVNVSVIENTRMRRYTQMMWYQITPRPALITALKQAWKCFRRTSVKLQMELSVVCCDSAPAALKSLH